MLNNDWLHPTELLVYSAQKNNFYLITHPEKYDPASYAQLELNNTATDSGQKSVTLKPL